MLRPVIGHNRRDAESNRGNLCSLQHCEEIPFSASLPDGALLPATDHKMQLYIIRHAQSTNNALADERLRVCDPPLTELGRLQAQIVAQHLASGRQPEPAAGDGHGGYGLTHLYTSPMWRALQTAQPIAQTLGLQPEIWLELHEQGGIYLDHGEGRGRVGYPGKTRPEVLAEFPGFVVPEELSEEGWWNRDYEEMPACYERACCVLAALARRAATDERIALLTHGAFIDAFLKALFHQEADEPLFYYNYNTAISRLDFHGDGRVDVHYLNRVDHLPVDLIS